MRRKHRIIFDKWDACMRPLRDNDKTIMLLSKAVQQYKATVSRRIRLTNNPEFKWQKSFYDHIIRSEREYGNIWDYIHYNPLKWQWDKENKENSQPDKKYYERLYEKETSNNI